MQLGEVAALVSQDRREEAISRLRRLAREGHSRAQLYLGWMYGSGEAGEIDHDVALRWYGVSAASGDPVGQFYYGCALFHLRGKDDGVRWLQRSAAQDYAPALYYEGLLSERGEGIEKDSEHAEDCLRRAAELGHGKAKVRLRRAELAKRNLWAPVRRLMVLWDAFRFGFTVDLEPDDKNMLG